MLGLSKGFHDRLTHTQAPPTGGAVRVLFACGHNAGRSQPAAALLAALPGA